MGPPTSKSNDIDKGAVSGRPGAVDDVCGCRPRVVYRLRGRREEQVGPSLEVVLLHDGVDDAEGAALPEHDEQKEDEGESDHVHEQVLRDAAVVVLDVERVAAPVGGVHQQVALEGLVRRGRHH